MFGTVSEHQDSIARGFLFADLRGYSAWVEAHGDRAGAELLTRYRRLVRTAVAEHHGAEIRTEGDSFYVAFSSPSAAVRCGLRILELCAEADAGGDRPIPVGIGVHAGETVVTDEGFVGSAVNIAARICAEARSGELLVSDAVRSLTRTYLDVRYQPRGRRRLKGIGEPIALYAVFAPGAAVPPETTALRWTKGGRWLAVGVAALALVGAVTFWRLADRPVGGLPSGESASSGSAGATATPPSTTESPIGATASPIELGGYPNAAEVALLSRVPAGDHDLCQRADPADAPIVYLVGAGQPNGPARWLASYRGAVECTLGGITRPDVVRLWDVVTIQWGDERGALTTHASLVDAQPGDCRESRPALETFSFGGASGRLLCYESSSGDAVLMWTFDGEHLFGSALRDDRDMDALLAWWDTTGRFTSD